MATPAFLQAYNASKARDRRPVYAEGTLGDLIKWFQEECPRWDKLSEASKEDYTKSFKYLEPGYEFAVKDLTPPDIYTLRNKAAKAKWGRFADKLVTHLSTIFKEAAKVGKIATNPAAGVEKLHKADPNANHEWRMEEVAVALAFAPDYLITPLMLARFQGFRGQTIAAMTWASYIRDNQFGRAFSVDLRKNNQMDSWFPCTPEMMSHLEAVARPSTFICVSSDRKPWKDEKALQGAVSAYLSALKEENLIREGCTLHGLRVTYAADIRRRGHDKGMVADALGDKSERMGAHYTRHVEKEASLIRIFDRKNGVQNS
ncbi:tyrosine-type recombinase/integrase [Phyllobacterium pellucidum]|nr:integrase [Phyllobacterium pellucidum]